MLLLFLPLLYIKNKKYFDRNIINIIIILILYFLYQIDLKLFFDRSVYFSDAEYYWNLYLNRDFSNFSRCFVFYIYITNLFGLFDSVILFSFNNIALHVITVFFISDLLKKYYKFSDKELKSIESKLLLNGIILFMVYRSIKDMLFIFLSVLLIYSYYKFFNKKKILFFIVIFIVLSYLLPQIRPWSFGLPIVLFLLHYIKKVYLVNKNIAFILIFMLLCMILISPNFYKYLNILKYLNEVHEESIYLKNDNGLLHYVKSFLVFILGPGPKRALLGSTYFQFYTNIGNILIFVGILQWYYDLSKFVLTVFINKFHLLNYMNVFFAFGVTLITIYSISYSGSVETRLRACMYYYIMPFFSILNKNYLRKINYKYIFILILFFVTVISILP